MNRAKPRQITLGCREERREKEGGKAEKGGLFEKKEAKSADFNLRIYKHTENIIRETRESFLDKFTRGRIYREIRGNKKLHGWHPV